MQKNWRYTEDHNLFLNMHIFKYIVMITIMFRSVKAKRAMSLQPTCQKRIIYPINISFKNENPSCIPYATTFRDSIHVLLSNARRRKEKSVHIENAQMIFKQEADLHNTYSNANITSEEDFKIHHSLDKADEVAKHNPRIGLEEYERIYRQHNSTRALFGIGKLSNRLAMEIMKDLEDSGNEEKDKNEMIENAQKLHYKSLNSMCKILHIEHVPRFLYLQAGKMCLELSTKMNQKNETIQALSILHKKYPKISNYGRQLGFELLLQLRLDQAEKVLRGVVNSDQESKKIKESYLLGLCLKLQKHNKKSRLENDDETNKLVELALNQEEDSLKVFNMIGSTYNRNRRFQEAEIVFDEGVRIGLFLSKWQRSSSKKDFRLKSLRGLPIWNPEQTGYEIALAKLRNSYQIIRQEGLSALFGSHKSFEDEAENLREEGLWQQLVLFETGVMSEKGCKLAPMTCNFILRYMRDISAECTHGQVKFSVIHSGTHVWPHSGPSNCRLRAHLGLVVPDISDKERLELRVADKYAHWKEGEFLIIDDSFEHEIWYQKPGGGIRLVLLIDMWHPDLTKEQRRNISPLVNRNQNHSTIFTVSGIVDKIPNN